LKRFPALVLAREALRLGPSHLIALNAANEIAVEAFLAGRLLFPQITETVSRVLENCLSLPASSLEVIVEIDFEARRLSESIVRSTKV